MSIYNPNTLDFRRNPFPTFQKLRTEAPVLKVPGGWVVSRFDDCDNILKSPNFGMRGVREYFRDLIGPGPALDFISRRFHFIDPPEHTRIRKLVSKAFSARRVLDMEPAINGIANELLNAQLDYSEFDLVDTVAYPMPAKVITEMLNIPASDWSLLADWTAPIVRLQETELLSSELIEAGNVAADNFSSYVDDLVRERKKSLGEDLLSALITAEEDQNTLALEEITATVMFLFNAGHHTTRDQIGNSVVALLQHRNQWLDLASDVTLIKGAIEECFRFDPSITKTLRVALEDSEVAGVKMSAGDVVSCLLSSANRDPDRFLHAEEFDITRKDNGHLAFGGGVHFCLGATLARLETGAVIRALLSACPKVELVEQDWEWRESTIYRGLNSIRLRVPQ